MRYSSFRNTPPHNRPDGHYPTVDLQVQSATRSSFDSDFIAEGMIGILVTPVKLGFLIEELVTHWHVIVPAKHPYLESVRNSDLLRSGRFGYLVRLCDSEISGAFIADEVDLRHGAGFGAYHPR